MRSPIPLGGMPSTCTLQDGFVKPEETLRGQHDRFVAIGAETPFVIFVFPRVLKHG